MGEPAASSQPDPVERFVGHGLAAVGALMLGLAGLCSATFAVMTLVSPGGGRITAGGVMGLLLMVGVFGGIPMGVGFLILRWGWRLRSPTRPPEPSMPSRDPLAGMIGVILGVAIAGAGAAASVWGLAQAITWLFVPGQEASYGMIFAPIPFLTGLVTVLGVWIALAACRVWRPRPPPSAPPPG